MTITPTFYQTARDTTPLSWAFLATHDGAAGNSLSITNAQLMANIPLDGPLRRLLSTVFASQAAARSAILEGNLSSIVGDPVCRGVNVFITPRDSVATVPWGVDVDVDVDGLPTLTVTGIAAAASSCLIALEYRHTATRG